LFPDAEYDYTSSMRLGVAIISLLCAPVVCLAAQEPKPEPAKSPHEIFEQLNALRLDSSSVYHVAESNRLELRKGDIQISFEEGNLAFFLPVDGRITGMVFSGRGHTLSTPRGVMEKQQMARFLGAPVLDQEFISAYIRFTDDTADDILRQLHNANVATQINVPFISNWESLLSQLNPPHSLRILFGDLSRNPKSYFYAAVNGLVTGPFDVLLDMQRDEPFVLGQPRRVKDQAYYDVWAAYQLPNASPVIAPFHSIQYAIDTTVMPDNSLKSTTTLRARAETSEERVMFLQLSRALSVESITDEKGASLPFFQNEGMSLQERSVRGNDQLFVILSEAPARGAEFTLHFKYRGNVIEDAGNGVLFVGARESWYPHLGDTAEYANYELTLRWPRKLKMAATGTKLDEKEEGDFRVGHWRTEKPTALAGFNLGDYAVVTASTDAPSIDIYANHQLEQALTRRMDDSDIAPIPQTPYGLPRHPMSNGNASSFVPSPAAELKQIGKQIDSSIHFFETFSGPFPYRHLSVSQIPGTFGQGWPGLLYVSTYSFLTPAAQRRAGLSTESQEHFTEIVPYHEVAHQWWGNQVSWSSYHDQWIDEAIANYLAVLFAETQRDPNHTLRNWLERYRQRLVEKAPNEKVAAGNFGALTLGHRLTSSLSPDGFDAVIYSKGTWVIHMLREMLRQPGTKNPDARFVTLLQNLSKDYAQRALSTEDFQREVEKVMTPSMALEGGKSMEWFFEEWVRGAGIPHYKVEYNVQRTEKGYVVKGKIFQTRVPQSFIAPVPLYISGGSGGSVLLGTVAAAGQETSFRFTTQTLPRKILIDPRMTVLSTTE
jgi:hypothetical protein